MAQTPLPFNLSHSSGVALIALSTSEVGIDIERIDDRGVADLGRLLAGIRTSGDVCDDASDTVARAFYRLWTRKEAYCKACGQGLHMPMQHFAVRPGHAPQTHEIRHLMPVDGPPWYVHDLPCEPGWMACICTTLPSPRVYNAMFIVPETGRPKLPRAEEFE